MSVQAAEIRVLSMSFMSDLADGHSLRKFNVIDDYNREGLTIEADVSLSSARVIRSLERNESLNLYIFKSAEQAQNLLMDDFEFITSKGCTELLSAFHTSV